MAQRAAAPVPLTHPAAQHHEVGARAHYQDPAYYSHAYRARQADVEYYTNLATQHRGPILEYGVGNGRVALTIARAGHRVVGVDHSREMLLDFQRRLRDEPREVQRRVELRRGDMRTIRLRRTFSLVIAPFNTVLHLYTRSDVERFLARVREHLTPRGRFVFDFSMPRVEHLMSDPERWYGTPRFRYPSTGQLVRYAERFDYDELTQVLAMRLRFTPEQGPSWETPLTQRQFFPQEMEALLHYNGFPAQRWSQDFNDSPPSRFADSLVVVARQRKPSRGDR